MLVSEAMGWYHIRSAISFIFWRVGLQIYFLEGWCPDTFFHLHVFSGGLLASRFALSLNSRGLASRFFFLRGLASSRDLLSRFFLSAQIFSGGSASRFFWRVGVQIFLEGWGLDFLLEGWCLDFFSGGLVSRFFLKGRGPDIFLEGWHPDFFWRVGVQIFSGGLVSRFFLEGWCPDIFWRVGVQVFLEGWGPDIFFWRVGVQIFSGGSASRYFLECWHPSFL